MYYIKVHVRSTSLPKRAEERWRMPSESYSIEKLHPVSNTFNYYFMILIMFAILNLHQHNRNWQTWHEKMERNGEDTVCNMNSIVVFKGNSVYNNDTDRKTSEMQCHYPKRYNKAYVYLLSAIQMSLKTWTCRRHSTPLSSASVHQNRS